MCAVPQAWKFSSRASTLLVSNSMWNQWKPVGWTAMFEHCLKGCMKGWWIRRSTTLGKLIEGKLVLDRDWGFVCYLGQSVGHTPIWTLLWNEVLSWPDQPFSTGCLWVEAEFWFMFGSHLICWRPLRQTPVFPGEEELLPQNRHLESPPASQSSALGPQHQRLPQFPDCLPFQSISNVDFWRSHESVP